jgi:hypothetical protein
MEVEPECMEAMAAKDWDCYPIPAQFEVWMDQINTNLLGRGDMFVIDTRAGDHSFPDIERAIRAVGILMTEARDSTILLVLDEKNLDAQYIRDMCTPRCYCCFRICNTWVYVYGPEEVEGDLSRPKFELTPLFDRCRAECRNDDDMFALLVSSFSPSGRTAFLLGDRQSRTACLKAGMLLSAKVCVCVWEDKMDIQGTFNASEAWDCFSAMGARKKCKTDCKFKGTSSWCFDFCILTGPSNITHSPTHSFLRNRGGGVVDSRRPVL